MLGIYLSLQAVKIRPQKGKKRQKIIAYLPLVLFFSWIGGIVRTRRDYARVQDAFCRPRRPVTTGYITLWIRWRDYEVGL